MNPTNRALILGATGGIGGEIARQLQATGWRVRALSRNAPRHADGLEWIRGDALDASAVMRASHDCDVIVHAVNPPGYRRWGELVLPMLDNTIAAARRAGALIVLPGTIYNYGPDALPLIDEDAPQRPRTRKGAIRVAMEDRLHAFAGDGGRALIVRAGDFFGPRPGNSWFSQGMISAGRPVQRIANPAVAGIGHQWAYLPDVARVVAALLGRRDELPAFARFHLAGYWDTDGQGMAQAIARVVTARTGTAPRIGGFPWWALGLAAPFNATFRELLEMRYLWRTPVRLDNTRLVDFLGHEPRTPLDEAVEATLRGIGCLPPAATRPPTASLVSW
ncbi:NAD-dependent epimerase/dehydratase family protein [Uliginosibacterium sp. sgz301328]|uniref:NAD-dependent epimerase/dehydratase family protein n=1 Tax=Uliginosibacterium sp. sgz301328 TaxID=3243764 RepID=UPI00359D3FA7